MTYEAGPTGFGPARAFTEAGIRCVVVAPSKLERRRSRETDRRDARRLARLLHIGEVKGAAQVEVTGAAKAVASDHRTHFGM